MANDANQTIINVLLPDPGSKVLKDIVEKTKTAKKMIPNTTGIKCEISARIECLFTSLSLETK